MLRPGPSLVFTPDLDEALAFYGGVLALSVAAEFDDQIVFDLGHSALHVFRCKNPAPAGEHGRDGATVITFEVDSLAETIKSLKTKGVRFLHQTPAINPAAGLIYAAFEGPGGVTHELVERQPT